MNDDIQEVEFLHFQIENGERIKRLIKNEDFKLLFLDLFLDNWSKTQMMNFKNANQDSRRRITEELLVRSGLSNYIEEIQNDAETARQELVELEQLRKQENEDNLG